MKIVRNFLFLLLLVVPGLLLAGDLVNINTATKEELQTLNGIGEAKAQAIIDYRTLHGPFGSLEDFDKVKGIGAETIKANLGKLTVGDVD
uniref:Competence protein ComEA n=1 Tax=Candidatus Kentrum sp. FM TaxID=2126340 RepID=A0A450SWC2_9GAMM|nr:MAG: competence protein ComEA [Candidatus Kentron sp. FM]VFJ64969.1 MAG: competence protein ComEA [Candidatus Kentron sp. FM]VFK12390.1 MAG: competence protein ComEA [Candidatus Kentron sp. FM]